MYNADYQCISVSVLCLALLRYSQFICGSKPVIILTMLIADWPCVKVRCVVCTFTVQVQSLKLSDVDPIRHWNEMNWMVLDTSILVVESKSIWMEMILSRKSSLFLCFLKVWIVATNVLLLLFNIETDRERNAHTLTRPLLTHSLITILISTSNTTTVWLFSHSTATHSLIPLYPWYPTEYYSLSRQAG